MQHQNLNSFILDLDKIQEAFNKKPSLEGKIISIKTVPLCKTILVKNLPITATSDSVCLNFESKRAGGDEVETVQLDEEKKIALVEFKYPNGKITGQIETGYNDNKGFHAFQSTFVTTSLSIG